MDGDIKGDAENDSNYFNSDIEDPFEENRWEGLFLKNTKFNGENF